MAARAKGMPERSVLRRHALPNALLPTVTILAIDAGILIGGVVVVEAVFAYPGLGRLLVFAIEHHDLPLLQAGMMVVTAVYALANLAADLSYACLNPRIRYGQPCHERHRDPYLRRRAPPRADVIGDRGGDRVVVGLALAALVRGLGSHLTTRRLSRSAADSPHLPSRIRSAPMSLAATCCPACWPGRICRWRWGLVPRGQPCPGRAARSDRGLPSRLVEDAIMRGLIC